MYDLYLILHIFHSKGVALWAGDMYDYVILFLLVFSSPGCQLFPLKVYYSRTAQQNMTKFGVKHHWGKGSQFCINEGACPPRG